MENVIDFNVQKYQEVALNTITDIQKRGKTPIIVGGTNYYIEALLFENNFKATDKAQEINADSQEYITYFEKIKESY